MRGRLLGRERGPDDKPERALLAAILLQALRDARAGDGAAARWLADAGARLAEEHFDIAPAAVARWAELPRRRVFVKRAAQGRQPRPKRPARPAARGGSRPAAPGGDLRRAGQSDAPLN